MEEVFYKLSTGYASQCYWAQEVDLSEVPTDMFAYGMRGFGGIVRMKITKGAKPCDFLGNSATLHIPSQRVMTLLAEHGLTVYDTYDVEVTGGTVDMPHYCGLAAVGGGGHILMKESGVEYGRRRPDGTRAIMGMKRVVFDENQWDESDFFYLDESPGGIIVTQRVADLFKKHRVRNCVLTPLEEVSF